MASPFRIFRKHQKKLIATLGILAVIAFCLPVGFQSFLGTRTTSEEEVVVVETTRYGNLTEYDLEMLMGRRKRVLGFIRRIGEAVTISKAASNQLAGEEGQVPVTAIAASSALNGIGEEVSEEGVVISWLLAKQAEQAGLEISDQAVRDFIEGITENCVPTSDVKQIIADLRYPTERIFFDELRHELLAWRAQMMMSVSLAGTTPAERWDYFRRLKRTATIEAIPVAVADYVDQIPEPSEQALRDLFEEGKDRVPSLASPDPAFRKPHQVAVRYFKADFGKVMASVTDEEIQEFCEDNKEYVDLLLQSFGRTPLADDTPDSPDDQSPSAEAPALTDPVEDEPVEGGTLPDEPAVDPAGIEPEEVDPETGVEPGTDTEEGAAGETGTDVADPAADSAADLSPADADTPVEEDAPLDETSGIAGPSTFRLAAFLQAEDAEPTADAAEESPAEESETETATPDEAATDEPAADETTVDEPASDEAAIAEPAVTEVAPAELAVSETDSETPNDVTEPGEEPALPALTAPAEPTPELPVAPEIPEPTFEDPTDEETGQPVEESTEPAEPAEPEDPLAGQVGDIIRQKLATDKIASMFEELRPKVERYATDLVHYELDLAEGLEPEKPAELDYAAMAKAADPTGDGALTTGQTPLMSQGDFYQDEEHGIGDSVIGASSPVLFMEFAFRDNVSLNTLYESRRDDISYEDASRFLFWKIEDSPEEDVTFDTPGVREQVLETWKMIEARKLALDEAEKLVAEGRKTGLSLSSTFIERTDVISPRPFSWMTVGNVPLGARAQPRLSAVTGIEWARNDFMKAIFAMERGEFGVVMNNPKTVAYAVRVGQIDPPEDVLQIEFEIEPYYNYAGAADYDRNETFTAWITSSEKAAGLKWNRPARKPTPSR